MTIWKFNVPTVDCFSLEMPVGARILSVQAQRGAPQMWILVDPDAQYEIVWFRVLGTGHELPEGVGLEYVGTWQAGGGELVWHLFREVG